MVDVLGTLFLISTYILLFLAGYYKALGESNTLVKAGIVILVIFLVLEFIGTRIFGIKEEEW